MRTSTTLGNTLPLSPSRLSAPGNWSSVWKGPEEAGGPWCPSSSPAVPAPFLSGWVGRSGSHRCSASPGSAGGTGAGTPAGLRFMGERRLFARNTQATEAAKRTTIACSSSITRPQHAAPRPAGSATLARDDSAATRGRRDVRFVNVEIALVRHPPRSWQYAGRLNPQWRSALESTRSFCCSQARDLIAPAARRGSEPSGSEARQALLRLLADLLELLLLI